MEEIAITIIIHTIMLNANSSISMYPSRKNPASYLIKSKVTNNYCY